MLILCLIKLLPVSSGSGDGRFLKLDDRPRLSGGNGSSVGLSKNDDVLDACGLGTVASKLVLTGATSISFLNRGIVDVDAGTTRGERGNGGGGPSGLGGRTSVAHEVLNRSLRDEVESERGLVVDVVVILDVYVIVFVGLVLG